MKPEPQKDSIADLTFDGRDSVPPVESDDVVLVYVGKITPPTQKQLEKYPFLKDEPAIELAPTKVQKLYLYYSDSSALFAASCERK